MLPHSRVNTALLQAKGSLLSRELQCEVCKWARILDRMWPLGQRPLSHSSHASTWDSGRLCVSWQKFSWVSARASCASAWRPTRSDSHPPRWAASAGTGPHSQINSCSEQLHSHEVKAKPLSLHVHCSTIQFLIWFHHAVWHSRGDDIVKSHYGNVQTSQLCQCEENKFNIQHQFFQVMQRKPKQRNVAQHILTELLDSGLLIAERSVGGCICFWPAGGLGHCSQWDEEVPQQQGCSDSFLLFAKQLVLHSSQVSSFN